MAEENISKKSGGEPVKSSRALFSGAHDYFVKNVLPDDIQAHTRTIKASTAYASNRDETFMLVRSGTGKMLINGLEYRLSPNTLVNLGPFHRYRFLPDKDSPLVITEARMNSGTYVYMIANPYVKQENLFVPSEPPVAHLTGLLAEIANDSMEGLLEEVSKKSPDKIKICFCHMMDLVGIITQKMPRSYFMP